MRPACRVGKKAAATGNGAAAQTHADGPDDQPASLINGTAGESLNAPFLPAVCCARSPLYSLARACAPGSRATGTHAGCMGSGPARRSAVGRYGSCLRSPGRGRWIFSFKVFYLVGSERRLVVLLRVEFVDLRTGEGWILRPQLFGTLESGRFGSARIMRAGLRNDRRC